MRRIAILLKRALDLGAGILGLLLLVLPFAVVAVAVKLDSRGPVFCRQIRVGKAERCFGVWKFRTMVVRAVSNGLRLNIARDDERITRVGRVLRGWELDELPQLINVLLGEMSLVGPRPTLAYQVEHYDDYQRRRLEVSPGTQGSAFPVSDERIVAYVGGISRAKGVEMALRAIDVADNP